MIRKLFLLALMTALLIPCGVALAQDGEPVVQQIRVDIKPGTCINPVNVKSRGVLPVAILVDPAIALEDISSIEVAYQPPDSAEDVAQDPITLLGEDDLPLAPLRTRLGDISSPAADCEEEVLDGIDDIALKYSSRALVKALADAGVSIARRERREITLLFTVTMLDATTLQGSDTILAKNPGKGHGNAGR